MFLNFALLYATIVIVILFPIFGVVFSHSNAFRRATQALHRQPIIQADAFKFVLNAMAFLETPLVLASIVGLFILSKGFNNPSIYKSLVIFSSIIFLAIISVFTSFVSGKVCENFFSTYSKNPNLKNKAFRFLVIMLTFCEIPLVLSTVVFFLILQKTDSISSLNEALKYVGAALSTCIGGVGPAVAHYLLVPDYFSSMNQDESITDSLLNYSFVIETCLEITAIFPFIISFLMVILTFNPVYDVPFMGFSFIAAAFCIVFGCTASSLGIASSSRAFISALLARNQEANSFFKMFLLLEVFIESAALISLIVASMIVFKITF